MIENMAHVVVFGLILPGQRMIAAVRIAPSVASPNSPRNGPELPMSGAGKFEGLEASIVITSMPLKGNYDNITQAIGHKKGTYKIVKTQ
jgi:hypothetical protein